MKAISILSDSTHCIRIEVSFLMLGRLVFELNTVFFNEKYIMQRSELTIRKGLNWPMEKVRIDQWKRSELTKGFFFLRSELTNKKGSELTSGRVRIDQWSKSELTRAEFFRVRID